MSETEAKQNEVLHKAKTEEKPKDIVAKVVEHKEVKKEPVQEAKKENKPKVKVISETVVKMQTAKKEEKKLGKKSLVVTSKRKSAIAKAYAKPGKGRIVINKRPYQLLENKFMLDLFREPLVLIEEYNPEWPNKLDIEIVVKGGGVMGQLVAARNCVTKAFVKFFNDPLLEKKIVTYNRDLLVDDPRRVETKKPLGPKARKKKQHSKR